MLQTSFKLNLTPSKIVGRRVYTFLYEHVIWIQLENLYSLKILDSKDMHNLSRFSFQSHIYTCHSDFILRIFAI